MRDKLKLVSEMGDRRWKMGGADRLRLRLRERGRVRMRIKIKMKMKMKIKLRFGV